VEFKGLLDQRNMILVGDLNLTTNIEEVLGVSALMDPLETFIKDLFSNHKLVDVRPVELIPTWCNGISGVVEIQKKLDRIYASEELPMDSACYRSWVELPYISNHAPMIFQLDYGIKMVAYPFKLNYVLLKYESFAEIVQEVWNSQ